MGVYRAALLLFVYTQRNRTHCGAKAQVCRPLLLYWTVSTTLSALGSSNEHRHGLNGRLQEIRTRHTFPLCITSVVVVWFTLIVGIYFRFCFFLEKTKININSSPEKNLFWRFLLLFFFLLVVPVFKMFQSPPTARPQLFLVPHCVMYDRTCRRAHVKRKTGNKASKHAHTGDMCAV